MKLHRVLGAGQLTNSYVTTSFYDRVLNFFPPLPVPVLLALLLALGAVPAARAQSATAPAIRFQFTQVRATVPVNSTNTTVLAGPTNTVYLLNGVASVNFDVSGLPAGAGATLTDGNGNPLTSTAQSTNLWVTLNTTNIPEGLYNFNLNVGGLDTNGFPVTNTFPFVLQAAHIWGGAGFGAASFGVSNNWTNATVWLGGLPAATDDVVFQDSGAQTNATYSTGIGFTNVGINSSITVGSLRFAQDTFTNLNPTNAALSSTNTFYHTLCLSTGATLTVTGTNGFSLLRDTIGEFGFAPDNPMGVNIVGSGASLMVSNASANFAILLGSQEQPTLSVSNLGAMAVYVNRMGIADYQLYPNYRPLNVAYNGGHDSNSYAGLPRRFIANVYLAKSNYITATYQDPNNYTNEFTRGYALSLQNNEQSGNGSSVNTYFYLGQTNVFHLDSVCFIGASAASGNTGGTKYNQFVAKASTNSPGTVFRNVDGVSRMSIFTVSDDGGTNQASSNVKATVDFTATANGYVDMLVDRLYVARDRTLIASNQSPNVQGDLTFGDGVVDANTMVLGFQEHSNKVDWTSLYGASPYLNYCQGRLVVTNGGGAFAGTTIKVNRTLTLGYTADNNPSGSAQQYNTYGSITIWSNATLQASNIVCDGGLNYYDGSGRRNAITLNQGANLIVTNMIGYPNAGNSDGSASDSRGMWLDTLTMTAAKLTLFVDPSKINVYARSFSTPGTIPSVIKVAGLTGVTSFPVQIPVIAYQGSAAPFLNADVSALGTNFFGYVLNDANNQTVDLYITTNPPNNLIWTGNINNNWDTSTPNWVTSPGGVVTNFNLGDLVTFNDSSSVTNVTIVNDVVPGQTGAGVTISNSAEGYVFNGGTVAGTALMVKQGTNSLEFDATEQGPLVVNSGSLIGAGNIGTTTIATNTLLNFTGNINGGLTSTGTVLYANGTISGSVAIQAGSLLNAGTITTGSGVLTMGANTAITNTVSGVIRAGASSTSSTAWDVPNGSTLVNFGTIYIVSQRLTVEGLLFGNGLIQDPNGGGYDSVGNAIVRIQSLGLLSPGTTPAGDVSNMTIYARVDIQNDPKNSPYGLGTLRVDVDFSNPQTNDIVYCDRWNDDTGIILMTNVNPGAGKFALGQAFTIFSNTSGVTSNYIDTAGFCPTIMPYVPGPGMQWGVLGFNSFGYITVTNSPLVWTGSGTGSWDTNSSMNNWKNSNVYTDNEGAIFDDSAPGSGAVNLVSAVAPEGYPSVTITNTDHSTFTNIFTLTNPPAIYPGIVVSNASKNYVISGAGKITGTTGIYKTGPGTLTLMTSNDFIGNVIIDNGTVAITNFGGFPNIVSLGTPGGGQMENDVILDGGTVNYVGTTNVGFNSYLVLNQGNGTIGVNSSTNIMSLLKNAVGLGGLTKTGPGTLLMSSATDDYQGGTTVSAGAVRLTAAAVGYGPITLNNGTSLQFSNTFTLTNAISIPGVAVNMPVFGRTNLIFSGPWTGSGSVTISNTGWFVFNNDLTGFGGILEFGPSSGVFQFNSATNKNPCTGSAAAVFDLGTGNAQLNNLNGGGLVYDLGALAGGANTSLGGRTTNSPLPAGTTYRIGASGMSTVFAGIISNGLDTVSLIKVGSGSLALTGVSTYTGSTTVSNGVLGGSGSIASPLTVASGGTLAPGVNGLATFTVNNTATLGGTVLLQLSQSNSLPVNDKVVVTGTLTGGGTLVVTNIGPDIINNSTFHLFSQAVNNFTSVTLPAKDPTGTKTYVWNNNLSSDGTIQLVSGGATSVNTNVTSMVASFSGGTLTLSWPSDHTGWSLEAETNPLGTGLYTNWYRVAGASGTNQVFIPYNPTNGAVFYRLVYP